MIQVVEVDLPVSAHVLESVIGDLTTYPRWMGLVHSVSPADDLGGYRVELRGKIGPFARSKVLRMERMDDSGRIRFVRRELDGRAHGRWELEAQITSSQITSSQTSSESTLTMTLLYEGRWWTSVVEKLLSEEVEASKIRLRDVVLGVGR